MTSTGWLEPTTAPDLRRSTGNSGVVSSRECWAWAGWETDRAYRRLGKSSTLYFGNGAWVSEWRRRIQQPETLRELQELGVTILITRFYKGFGMKTEAEEWEEIRGFVRQAQNLGMKVWGYLQGGSLYGETLFLERPDAREWVARTSEGKPLLWASYYFRFMPCLNHPGYLAWMQDLIGQGLLNLGFDSLHIDNNYYHGCHCERCAGLFRAWLNARPDLEALTGLPDAGAVMPPPAPPAGYDISDPLRILWIAFNVETRRRFYKQLYRHLKSLRPEAQLSANPAFPRDLSSRLHLSLDPRLESEFSDFVMAENGNQPGWHAGLVSQAEAHLMAEAGGYQTLSSTWRHDAALQNGPPQTPAAVWAGIAEEFSHSRAALGNNWMLRPSGEHDRLLADALPERMDAFREAMGFFRDLETQVNFPARRTWGEVGVLLNPESLSLTRQSAGEACRAVIRYLLLRRLPFRILFSPVEATPEMKFLIACHQNCLSDTEMDDVSAFAATPGRRAILLGDTGRFNEWFIPRNERDWRTWLAGSGMHHFDLPLASSAANAGGHMATRVSCVSAPMKRALDSALLPGTRRVRGPHQILLHIETGEDGSLFFHLRDQSGISREISGVRVHVGGLCPPDASFRAFPARLKTDGGPRPITLRPETGWIPLPPFAHYGLLTLESPNTTPNKPN
jgi:hypothetical protein